ncbi:MAG TPA: toprim domain-containing protein [Candidatus Nanoarchaeia archaeon]|nr:toprim domain-containing protein [Candidatus Nanoarchaeia archaeon]
MHSLTRALEHSREKLVLVEGKKDKQALESLGFTNIVSLQNRPLFEVVETIQEKEVVLLTDLDKEGRRLFSILKKGLERQGTKVHSQLRFELLKAGLVHIETLTEEWIAHLEDRKNLTLFGK